MHKKNRVVVRILGQEYKLLSEEPQEYMQHVASYVDGKMLEIAESNKKLSAAMIAVLACLNIADEYHKAVEERNSMERNMQYPSYDLDTMHQRLKAVSDELEHRNRDYEKMVQDFEILLDNSSVYEEELQSLREKMNMLSYELNNKEELLKRSNNTIRDLRRQVPEPMSDDMSGNLTQPRDPNQEAQMTFDELEE